MKNTFKIFIVVMSICNIAYAQTTFNITTNFGIDITRNVVEVDSGYYTVVTSSPLFLPRHEIFSFYDTLGILKWSKVYGDSMELYDDFSLFKDSSNNFIMGSGYYSSSLGHYRFSLRKVNQFGDSIWHKIYGPDTASDYVGLNICNSIDNGFLLTGQKYSSSGDFATLKADSNGNFSWYYSLIGTNGECAYDAAETINHDYLVVGWTRSFGNGNINFKDAIVVCIDSVGTYKWKKTFGNFNLSEGFFRIANTKDGNFLMCGGNGNQNGVGNAGLWKIDSLGNVIWQHFYPTYSNGSIFYSVKELDNGNIVAVGTDLDSTHTFDEAWIVKLDSLGQILQDRRFSVGNYYSIFNEVKPTKDGGFIIAGYVLGGPNGQDGWLLKLDSNLCDMPGCSINTSIQEAPNYTNVGDVIVFPNPCTDDLFLKPQFGSRIESITVYDLTGKELKLSMNITRELCQINTSELSSGIYIARMKIENSFKTIKFIKQ